MNRTNIVICGCGHVAQELVKLAKLVGYECTVIEDREEYAEAGRLAGADTVICGRFEQALTELDTDEKTFFVIMTREHTLDLECLKIIAEKKHAYVGMMGSHRRAVMVREIMAKEGLSDEFLAGIHAPIGVPIYAQTPQEIAVSAMAEIIKVRAEAGIQNEDSADFLEAVRQRKRSGIQTIQAEIVKKIGSAPRGVGTKMLIDENGECFGTIGGGYVEAMVIERAKQMLAEDLPDEIVHNTIRSSEEAKERMYCGGDIDVKLERLK